MTDLAKPTLLAAERQAAIVDRVRQKRSARVTDLAAEFGVSPMTVRRDIELLDDEGLLERVHGGARVPVGAATAEPQPDEKQLLQQDEKSAIARTALQLVHPGQAIGLSAGTTTLALASLLHAVPDLTVVTNSVPIADELRRTHDSASVILTGGVRTISDALVGPVSLSALRQLHIDTLFFGSHGVDGDAGCTTPNMLEAETNRQFIDIARRRVLLADSTKWGVLGLSTFAALDDVDEFITDAALPDSARETLVAHLDVIRVVDPATGTVELVRSHE